MAAWAWLAHPSIDRKVFCQPLTSPTPSRSRACDTPFRQLLSASSWAVREPWSTRLGVGLPACVGEILALRAQRVDGVEVGAARRLERGAGDRGFVSARPIALAGRSGELGCEGRHSPGRGRDVMVERREMVRRTPERDDHPGHDDRERDEEREHTAPARHSAASGQRFAARHLVVTIHDRRPPRTRSSRSSVLV